MIILGLLTMIILLIFCIVDLWHLKEMLKELRILTIYLREYVERG